MLCPRNHELRDVERGLALINRLLDNPDSDRNLLKKTVDSVDFLLCRRYDVEGYSRSSQESGVRGEPRVDTSDDSDGESDVCGASPPPKKRARTMKGFVGWKKITNVSYIARSHFAQTSQTSDVYYANGLPAVKSWQLNWEEPSVKRSTGHYAAYPFSKQDLNTIAMVIEGLQDTRVVTHRTMSLGDESGDSNPIAAVKPFSSKLYMALLRECGCDPEYVLDRAARKGVNARKMADVVYPNHPFEWLVNTFRLYERWLQHLKVKTGGVVDINLTDEIYFLLKCRKSPADRVSRLENELLRILKRERNLFMMSSVGSERDYLAAAYLVAEAGFSDLFAAEEFTMGLETAELYWHTCCGVTSAYLSSDEYLQSVSSADGDVVLPRWCQCHCFPNDHDHRYSLLISDAYLNFTPRANCSKRLTAESGYSVTPIKNEKTIIGIVDNNVYTRVEAEEERNDRTEFCSALLRLQQPRERRRHAAGGN